MAILVWRTGLNPILTRSGLLGCAQLLQQRPHLRVIRLQRRQATGGVTRRIGISGIALERH